MVLIDHPVVAHFMHIDATRDELVDFVAEKLTGERVTQWRERAASDFTTAREQAHRLFGVIVYPTLARKRP